MADLMAYRGPGGGWIYPPLEEALKKAGLHTMEHYVNKRQQRIVDYISTRPIWAHCMVASRKPGVDPGFPFRLTPMSFALRVTNSP